MRVGLWLVLALSWGVAAEDKHLRVAVAGSPPFVTHETGQVDGLSIRVWKEIARRGDYDYDFQVEPGVGTALQKVASGQVDMLVGPVTITADRARTVSFTQPYFKASLGILSNHEEYPLWSKVRPFFSRAFVAGSVFLLSCLFVVGGSIWLLERKRNAEHFPKGAQGLGNGMWFAMVTMTTVGYGDLAPRTPLGRVVAAVWMLVAALSFSTLTAGIATALALSSIDKATASDPQILHGRRAAVVKGTTAVDVVSHAGAQLQVTDDLTRAIALLDRGATDVVVFDYPALQFYMARHPDPDLTLVDTQLAVQYYGLVVGKDSHLRAQLDYHLLKMREEGSLAEIEALWNKAQRK